MSLCSGVIMDPEELKERFDKALVFLDRLKEYASNLRVEIDDIRKVSFQITTMIISDVESLRDELLSLTRRIVAIEKKK